jgi:hypothetical protein
MRSLGVIAARLTHKIRRRSLLRFLFLLALLVLAGCSLPNKPGDLSWDVHLYVPLDVRHYRVNDLVGTLTVSPTGSSGIGMGTDSVLYFSSVSHLMISIHDSLTLDPLTFNLYKPEGMQDTNAVFLLNDQRNRVFNGRIASGTLALHAEGAATSDTQQVRITLPAIQINALGDPFIFTDTLWSGQPLDTVIYLAGYRIVMADSTPQRFSAHLVCSSPTAVSATLHSSRITFSYLDGEINQLRLESAVSGTKIDRPPDGWETVHPTTADAYLRVTRGMSGAQADLDAELFTYLQQAKLDSQRVNLSAVELNGDSTSVIHGLGHMIAQYPDSASATGTVVINGRVRSYAIDTLRLDVEVRAPLRFTMDTVHFAGTVRRVDTDDLHKIQAGTAIVRVWNRLPVGSRVFVVLARDSLQILPSSTAHSDTLTDVRIPVAMLQDGRAVSDTFSEYRMALTDSTIFLLQHPPFFARTDVLIPGTGRDTLVAHAADYLRVQAIADVTYRVGGEGTP